MKVEAPEENAIPEKETAQEKPIDKKKDENKLVTADVQSKSSEKKQQPAETKPNGSSVKVTKSDSAPVEKNTKGKVPV